MHYSINHQVMWNRRRPMRYTSSVYHIFLLPGCKTATACFKCGPNNSRPGMSVRFTFATAESLTLVQPGDTCIKWRLWRAARRWLAIAKGFRVISDKSRLQRNSPWAEGTGAVPRYTWPCSLVLCTCCLRALLSSARGPQQRVPEMFCMQTRPVSLLAKCQRTPFRLCSAAQLKHCGRRIHITRALTLQTPVASGGVTSQPRPELLRAIKSVYAHVSSDVHPLFFCGYLHRWPAQ